MTYMSRLLQDNSCGKNAWKSIKYSESYDTVCQLAILGFQGLRDSYKARLKLEKVIRLTL